jgi:hypothetical protein
VAWAEAYAANSMPDNKYAITGRRQEPPLRGCEFTMAAEKNVLGFIDASRKVRRPPLVGMQFLHQRSVSATNLLGARPRLHAKDLISLLFRHFAARPRAPRPRCRTSLRVFTPAGLPAVEIRHK